MTGTISAYSGPSSVSRSRYRMKRAMRPGSARSVRSCVSYRQLAAGTCRQKTPQTLVGHALARNYGWQPGDHLRLQVANETVDVVGTGGVLSSGGDEDNQLVMPLSIGTAAAGSDGKSTGNSRIDADGTRNELCAGRVRISGLSNAEEVKQACGDARHTSLLLAHQLEGHFRCGSAPSLAGCGLRRSYR